MTENQFMERMVFLTEKLANICEEQPFDEDARRGVMVEVYATKNEFKQSRRRRPWAAVMFVICLFLVLLYIVWEILFNLKITERQ